MPGIDYLIRVGQLCRDVYDLNLNTLIMGIRQLHTFRGGHDIGCAYVSDDTVYIVVRGSDDTKDWMSNSKAVFRADWYGISGHRGFVSAARELEAQVLDILSQHPDHNLVFAGHSRGGAIALLLAIAGEIHHKHKVSQCITFGQPRVSSAKQIRLAYRHGEYIRVQNGSDAVCRWPKVGYGDAGTCFYLTNRDDGYLIDPSPLNKFTDRALTIFSRGKDHSVSDYLKELEKCKNWESA